MAKNRDSTQNPGIGSSLGVLFEVGNPDCDLKAVGMIV